MDEEPSEKLSHSKVLDQSIYVDSKETTEEFDNKQRAIETACQNRDVKSLVEHATSAGGLLTDTLRQAACMCDPFFFGCDNCLSTRNAGPILLGYDTEKGELRQDQPDWKSLPRHGDEDQVKLDVNRSFVYYPQC